MRRAASRDEAQNEVTSRSEAKTPSQSPEHSEGEAWGTKGKMKKVESLPSPFLDRLGQGFGGLRLKGSAILTNHQLQL